jgi:phosphoenolpyruvate-protein phosphotransferase (PTS system enzyme I)
MTASGKTDLPTDTFLVGIGVSPGVAIGQVHLVNRARMAAIERQIAPAQIEPEIELFRNAIRLSRQQLEQVKSKGTDERISEHLYIIDTHLLILEDQMLVEGTIELIRNQLLNAEGALKKNLSKVREVFNQIEDEYLRERNSDIDSVGERVLRNLMGESQQSITSFDRKGIIVAHVLSPTDTLQMDRSFILGFVTDMGGRTSHTAILARSLGIPAVVGLESVTSLVAGGSSAIIDGTSGTVILNPSPETFREYLQKKRHYDYGEKELLAYRRLPAETLDGHLLTLRSNIELIDEVSAAQRQGAEGIGLFRSEFLYLGTRVPPDEETQYRIYRKILQQMAPHEVTIRTLDVGGDKFVPDINLSDEPNPALGLRGIRFSLADRVLFKAQLRAILRASAHGPTRLMLPMVSGVAEVRDSRQLINQVMLELEAEGHAFDREIAIGIMIETPSAVLIADLLAAEVDFFSVGTNDLIQYCLAVDRANEHVAYLYEPLHPAILRALQTVCAAGRKAGIPVSMCGEMAGEPFYVPILLGLGFSELSMNPPCISRVKRIVRQFTLSEARALLDELLCLPTALEIAHRLEDEMAERLPEQFGGLQI